MNFKAHIYCSPKDTVAIQYKGEYTIFTINTLKHSGAHNRLCPLRTLSYLGFLGYFGSKYDVNIYVCDV